MTPDTHSLCGTSCHGGSTTREPHCYEGAVCNSITAMMTSASRHTFPVGQPDSGMSGVRPPLTPLIVLTPNTIVLVGCKPRVIHTHSRKTTLKGVNNGDWGVIGDPRGVFSLLLVCGCLGFVLTIIMHITISVNVNQNKDPEQTPSWG